MTRVKVCGITRWEDAALAADLGADALGFIFYLKSPRFVPPEKAWEIIRRLPPFVATVGVFVDAPAEEVRGTAARCRLTAVQLHGAETPAFCRGFDQRVIKALRVKGDLLPRDLDAYLEVTDAILLDAYRPGVPGGTGEVFAWEVAREAVRRARIVLAGGLNPANVRQAIESAGPYAVDVSSGVEMEPGKKDPQRLTAFMQTVNRLRGTT